MGRFLQYASDASLNFIQRRSASEFTDRRVPLVFGTDVFVSNPRILSHRITVNGTELQHQSIAVASYGQGANDITGTISKIDNSLYVDGIKLRNGSVIETRPGAAVSPVYSTHSQVHRAIEVQGTQITIPTKLPDGSVIQSGEVFYQTSSSAWASIVGVPGQVVTTPFSASWLSLRTSTSANFPSIATALTTITSDTYNHPDLYVREGKTVERLIAAGKGAYQADNNHIVSGQQSYLIDVKNGKRYPLPLAESNSPTFNADSEWAVTRPGISDRFPDVVHALLTSSAGGSSSTVTNHAMIDYQSLVLSNAHVDRLGLKLSGVISGNISFIDFVTDYSMWFDLVTIRRRNTFGLLPDSTEDTYITGIFTPFNVGDMAKIYESNYNRSYTQIGTFIGDNLDPVTVPLESPIVLGNQHYIDSSFVSQNPVQLKQQMQRIAKAITTRDISLTITAPVGVRTILAGDFIIGESEYFTDNRIYNGGIIRSPIDGIYNVEIYDSVYIFVANNSIVNGVITIDSKARRDGFSVIKPIEGDYVTLVGDDKLPLYAKVTNVDVNATGITIRLAQIKWDATNKVWVDSSDTINVAANKNVSVYRFGDIPTDMFFYDNDGIPRKSAVKTYMEPDPSDPTNAKLRTYLKFTDYAGTVADATPVIYDKHVVLWRVSSVEPVTSNLMGKAIAGVRNTQGYRISATIYPDGIPKTYAPTVLPPDKTVDTKATITPPTASSAEIEDYIVSVAIGNEFDKNDAVTHKWRSGPVTIAVVDADQDDLSIIDKVIDELKQLTGMSLSVVTSTPADVTMTFAPEDTFTTIFPAYPGGNLGYFDATLSATAPADITSGIVLIDNSSKTTRAERNHLIREELTQLLTGMMNDSYRYADSIFQQGWTETQGYSEIDKEAIRVFAHPSITSGMTATQLRDIIKTL